MGQHPLPGVADSTPFSPALRAHVTTSEDFEAGERGELGWDFYPGRRTMVLAPGYIAWPL